tara:strand:+ start:449 stop:1063 length:615 start_codon:yes stop_codon:yes gene_type:complete
MFFFSQASAVGLNIGVSGVTAVFHAEGQENENGELSKEDATGVAGYASVFAEIRLNEFFAVGVDYVPEALESETSETVVYDKTTSDTRTAKTNKVQVDFEELTSAYIMVNLTEGLYVRGGVVQVDVVTNESLGTGSTYDDTDMDGTIMGIGYNRTLDNGLFFRVEGNYMDLGSASLTATNNAENKISLNDLQGASARIAVGKAF